MIWVMTTTNKKVGRPTKYSSKVQKDAEAYLESCQDEYEEWHKTRGEKSDTYERYLKVDLPSVEGLALELKVHRDTLYEWASKHDEFSDTLERLNQLQKKILTNKALAGHYNPVIAKLMLTVNHDMIEKKEVDVTSKGEQITGFNYVEPDGETND